MVRLCSDKDILKYEPALFGELYLTNQVVAAGTMARLPGRHLLRTGRISFQRRLSRAIVFISNPRMARSKACMRLWRWIPRRSCVFRFCVRIRK